MLFLDSKLIYSFFTLITNCGVATFDYSNLFVLLICKQLTLIV